MTLEEQVQYLANKVDKLEQEIATLKNESASTSFPVQNNPIAQQTVQSMPAKQKEMFDNYYNRNNQTKQNIQTVPNTNIKVVEQQKIVKDKKVNNMEQTIGTKVMGLLASLLVFIALVVFGSLIYNNITDTMKAVIMLCLSGIFTLIGLRKNKTTKFKTLFTSLFACGIGAFYITFCIMSLGFHLISSPVLAILLFGWVISVALISKNSEPIFKYICYVGIMLSTTLCILEWSTSIVPIVFYLSMVGLLIYLHRSKDYSKNIFWFVQFSISITYILLLYDSHYSLNKSFMAGIMITLCVINTLIYGFNFVLYNLDEKSNITGFISTIIFAVCSLVSIVTVASTLDSNFILNFSCLLFAGIIWLLYKKCNNSISYYVMFFYTGLLVLFLDLGSFYIDYVSIAIFIIPLLLIGFLKDKLEFKILAYFYLFLYSNLLMPTESVYEPVSAIVSICILGFLIYFYFQKKDNYLKYFLTAELVIFSLVLWFSYDYLNVITCFILLSIISLFINTKYYRESSDKSLTLLSTIVSYILNSFMMLMSIVLINDFGVYNLYIVKEIEKTELFASIIVVLIALALYFRNTDGLFRIKLPEMLTGFYIGLKFTILINVILYQICDVVLVVSIFGIILAIVFIVLGFKIRHKSFRLYGLVLSMISIVKLVLFDFSHDSTLSYAVGFLVSGILCFMISMIYNRIEKQEEI